MFNQSSLEAITSTHQAMSGECICQDSWDLRLRLHFWHPITWLIVLFGCSECKLSESGRCLNWVVLLGAGSWKQRDASRLPILGL
jgi:hypothetical protein